MGTHTSFSARISENNFLRYALAVLAVLMAALLSAFLSPALASSVSYPLMLLAMSFSAWYCGIGPTILAMILAAAGEIYGFSLKLHPAHFPTREEEISTLLFLLSSVLMLVMGESRRRENERLRQSEGALEIKVQERTADLDSVNRSLRDLSARLLQMQDEERRRIARELHDSIGQTLAALSMNLSAVRNDIEHLAQTTATLNDSEGLLRGMVTEVRTISHLLHPPLLDEAGLSSALRWYVDGFSQRSGIKVDLDMSEDFRRLPSDFETAIFRIVQECLTNIHRHSASPVARIRVRERDHLIAVEIEDKGRGIPPDKLAEMASSGTPGVGVRGMQERLRQLGGKLEIESNGNGTVIRVRLPLPHASGTEPVPLPDESSHAAA